MGNSAWICFDCHEAVRRLTQHREEVPCPACGKTMYRLGYKIPVPPKRDEKTWNKLREQLLQTKYARREEAQHAAVRRKHEIEKQIRELVSKPENEGRHRLIRRLRKELSRIQ